MTSGVVVWLTGLPSSGKSTLARAVAARLAALGRPSVLLDGDDVRAAIVPRHGYDAEARAAFYETLARLAALVAVQGHVVLVPATAQRRAWREAARALAPRFVEVHVATPEAECRARDAKGLYARAPAELPGEASYEPPAAPDVVAPLGDSAAAVDAVVAAIVAATAH